MALSQSVASELLEAFRAGEGVDLVRESVRLVMQDLIEAEATEVVGAGRYERNDSRVSCRPRTRRNSSSHRHDRRSRHGGDHRHQWPAGAARSRRCTLMRSRSVCPAAYHSTRSVNGSRKLTHWRQMTPLWSLVVLGGASWMANVSVWSFTCRRHRGPGTSRCEGATLHLTPVVGRAKH